MKYTAEHKPNWLASLTLPLLIFIACYFITLTEKFKSNNALLSTAILIDLIVIAPLIYFLVIRKSNVAKLTVTRVFIAGILVAGFILKPHSNYFFDVIKTWISPFIEAFVIFFIGRKFYTANKKAKAVNNNIDFLAHCQAVMKQVVGNEKIGNMLSSEISVLYYAFISRKDKRIDYQTKFTSYKENSITTVLWVILFIFLIETAGVHILLHLWNTTIAWIFTGLSLYTCIQLYAHIKAVKARPVIINGDSFDIHNGLAGDAYIQFDNIEKFELSKKIPKDRNAVKIALIKGLENHNVVVYLKTTIQVTKIFGIKKHTDTVLFFVDKPNEFSTALTSRLKSNGS